MRGIISQAEAINIRVHDHICPELYLFCNFDEGICWWISEDAKYLHHVLNLYKVMIDTNYVTGRSKLILANNDNIRWRDIKQKIAYDDLKRLTDSVNCFRSVVAHNISESNGYFQKNEMEEYRQWVFSVIHTDRPTTDTHFSALNAALEKISLQFEKYIGLFLDYVEQAVDKDDIVERWKNAIINKYVQKEDYLYGQMADMYFLLYRERYRRDVPKGMDKSQMRSVISKWIMNYYIEPYVKAEEIIENECHRKEGIVKSEEARIALRKQAKRKKDSLTLQKEEKLKLIYERFHLGSVEELCRWHYSQYFLEVTMPECIKELLEKNPNCSLLPQEILQLFINTYMRELEF